MKAELKELKEQEEGGDGGIGVGRRWRRRDGDLVVVWPSWGLARVGGIAGD